MLRFLRKLLGADAPVRSKPRRRVRLGLETLDERVLPAVSPLGDVSGALFGSQSVGGADRTVARSSTTGNYAVTWQAAGNGYGGDGIYVRLFNATGTALTGAIHVGTTTTAKDFSPTIAMNAGGQFAVAWSHFATNTNTDVYAQRFNASGFTSGGVAAVAISSHNEYEASAGLDSYGNLMVAYTYQDTANDRDVYAWKQRADGSANTFVVANSYQNEHAPSLAVTASGLGVVAYAYDYSTTDTDIYAQRVYTGGLGVGGPPANAYGAAISVATSGLSQTDPSASINASGAFVVSYTEMQGAGGTQVFAVAFDSASNYRQRVSVGAAGDVRNEFQSSVVIDDVGRFLVAYADSSSGPDYDVRAEVFNADLSVRDAWFYVASSYSAEYAPTVALGVTDLTSSYSGGGYYYGQGIVAYETYGIKSDGYGYSGYGVYAARVYSL